MQALVSRIFTSRYQNAAIASSGLVPIGITLGNPRFRLGYALAANLRQLAPTRAMFHLTDRAAFEPARLARAVVRRWIVRTQDRGETLNRASFFVASKTAANNDIAATRR